MKLRILEHLILLRSWWGFDDYSILNKKGKVYLYSMYFLSYAILYMLIMFNLYV